MDRGMKFSTGIVHRLLIRELHHDGPEDEIRFMLGRHSVWFSKVEFCLITGLKFGELPDTSTYDMVENGIHQRYFEGRDEVEYEELKAVLRIGVFSEQYDAVKLCLLYMLNWILMGLDEREKVPVWQFRLVEDLDAFDAFPWGAHVYRRSIYGFNHALDGRHRRFEQRQRRKGIDVHTTETYNIYGLTHALLIFAFEVIPEFGNSGCGKRREIELSPRILKWELSTRPRGEKLNSIFLESMFARVKLVPTATERAERYFEGISQGGSLYDADLGDIPVPVSDLERYTTAGTSDTEGSSFEPSDTEGSDSDGRHIRLARTRRVRFTLPREPRTRDDSRTGDNSRGGVGRQAEDRRYIEPMDALRELQEEVRKSNEKRDQHHQELLDLIRGLQGSTSHARTRGTWFNDPPFDDNDGHRDFSPRGRIGSHQGDQHGPSMTPREEVTRGHGTKHLLTAHPSGRSWCRAPPSFIPQGQRSPVSVHPKSLHLQAIDGDIVPTYSAPLQAIQGDIVPQHIAYLNNLFYHILNLCPSGSDVHESLDHSDHTFKPGWNDIFRMNQNELEAEIRKVSRDSTLDPRRKAYLIQNLMTSRWIAAQQKLLHARDGESSNGEDLLGCSPSFRDPEKQVFGCGHYKRNCKLRAVCCGKLFACRFCHDKVSDHSMDRKGTTEMMCMRCLKIQPAGPVCTTPSCGGFSMAKYYCSICRFFDDERHTHAVTTSVRFVANPWEIWRFTLACLMHFWLPRSFQKNTGIAVSIYYAMTAIRRGLHASTGCTANAGPVVRTIPE
ncbi:hypothetical protein LWI28_008239 [Acer negundo]|uniref:CHY-type domain-containing protein n=1 Tax=Acer negundo TaxID=4023 RepID=A0AAD5ILV0_ACENE|nr:hypothetical protein LWI28_008239 [Acer negundo]